MRVLQLITELRPAGAERIVYWLAAGLPRERFQPEVACISRRRGQVGQWLAAAGVPVHYLDAAHKADARALPRLRAVLAAGRFDVLHTHLFHANLLGRLAARRGAVRALVSHAHVVERRLRPWRRWLDRWTARRTDCQVCVSEAVRRHLEHGGFPAEKLVVIRNGIDLAPFARPPSEEEARRLRAELGLAPEDRALLFAGRLNRQKDPLTLLAAMPAILARAPAAALLVAGDGPLRARAERLAARLGLGARARFLGWRPDVPALLAISELLVMPSAWEGFGLAAAEALAAGVPVVAGDVDSLPEVVGGCGALVPPGDAAALALAVAGLLAAPERLRELGRAGRERARAEFARERMVAEVAALYERLAGG